MQKYKVTWYTGSVIKIEREYKSIIVKSNSIDEVDYMQILPIHIRKQSFYQRKIFTNENQRNIDYGSYINFIEIKEI